MLHIRILVRNGWRIQGSPHAWGTKCSIDSSGSGVNIEREDKWWSRAFFQPVSQNWFLLQSEQCHEPALHQASRHSLRLPPFFTQLCGTIAFKYRKKQFGLKPAKWTESECKTLRDLCTSGLHVNNKICMPHCFVHLWNAKRMKKKMQPFASKN